MNGCTIPYTPIAVDFWKLRDSPQARVFFLTHLHGDHIAGLTSSWEHTIYCSELTAELLHLRHGIRKSLVKPLELNRAHIVYLDREHDEQMTVTLIDANHCPGAVMFLFQGYFGTILHTGDFRFHPDMITDSPLSQLSGKIDVLYLDNTYCSPKCIFPSREEAIEEILDIIKHHPYQNIVIGMRSLGKEDLLQKVAMTTEEWISVPGKLYQTLQLLKAPDVFKCDDSDCRIRVVPFHSVSNRNMARWNEEAETIAILPTSLYKGINQRPFAKQDNVFIVPYSDHSSYPEIVEFVSFLRPARVFPVVAATARGPFGESVADRADMSWCGQYLSDKVVDNVEIPASVKRFMSGGFGSIPSNPSNKDGRNKRKARRQLQRENSRKNFKMGVHYGGSSDMITQNDLSENTPSCLSENSISRSNSNSKLEVSTPTSSCSTKQTLQTTAMIITKLEIPCKQNVHMTDRTGLTKQSLCVSTNGSKSDTDKQPDHNTVCPISRDIDKRSGPVIVIDDDEEQEEEEEQEVLIVEEGENSVKNNDESIRESDGCTGNKHDSTVSLTDTTIEHHVQETQGIDDYCYVESKPVIDPVVRQTNVSSVDESERLVPCHNDVTMDFSTDKWLTSRNAPKISRTGGHIHCSHKYISTSRGMGVLKKGSSRTSRKEKVQHNFRTTQEKLEHHNLVKGQNLRDGRKEKTALKQCSISNFLVQAGPSDISHCVTNISGKQQQSPRETVGTKKCVVLEYVKSLPSQETVAFAINVKGFKRQRGLTLSPRCAELLQKTKLFVSTNQLDNEDEKSCPLLRDSKSDAQETLPELSSIEKSDQTSSSPSKDIDQSSSDGKFNQIAQFQGKSYKTVDNDAYRDKNCDKNKPKFHVKSLPTVQNRDNLRNKLYREKSTVPVNHKFRIFPIGRHRSSS